MSVCFSYAVSCSGGVRIDGKGEPTPGGKEEPTLEGKEQVGVTVAYKYLGVHMINASGFYERITNSKQSSCNLLAYLK